MQEKIEKILTDKIRMSFVGNTVNAHFDMREAAAEIVALFERKVIWDDVGSIRHVNVSAAGYDWDTHVDVGRGGWRGRFRMVNRKLERDGQRVRVIVEHIDESRT